MRGRARGPLHSQESASAAALAERQEKGAAAQPLCGLVLINLSKSNPPGVLWIPIVTIFQPACVSGYTPVYLLVLTNCVIQGE